MDTWGRIPRSFYLQCISSSQSLARWVGWGCVTKRLAVHTMSRPGRLCFRVLSSCHAGFGKALTSWPDSEQARDRPHGSWGSEPSLRASTGASAGGVARALVSRWREGGDCLPRARLAHGNQCSNKKCPHLPSTESPWEVATDPFNTF